MLKEMLQNLPTKIQNNEKVIPLIFPQQINILFILSNYDRLNSKVTLPFIKILFYTNFKIGLILIRNQSMHEFKLSTCEKMIFLYGHRFRKYILVVQ